jgi:hypothetical protein
MSGQHGRPDLSRRDAVVAVHPHHGPWLRVDDAAPETFGMQGDRDVDRGNLQLRRCRGRRR